MMVRAMSGNTQNMSFGQATLTITDRELFERLGWFTHVRWAFGAFCLLALLLSWHVFGVRFRAANGSLTMAPAVNVVLILFLYNAAFTFLVRIVRERRTITRKLIESIALLQISCDLIAICALIHYTGGVRNFFVLLILVPIVIVAELLPKGLAYATAATAALLINAIAWGQQLGLVQHVHAELAGAPGPVADPYARPFHLLLVSAALTVTIFAMVFVTTTIAARLRAREGELEEAHRQLRLSDEAKGFFMRRAEHEIRAPLAAIQSILGAIAAGPEGMGQDQAHRIRRAIQRAEGLQDLVSDLRRYSRLRPGAPALQTGLLCFGDIVTDTVDLFSKQAEDGGITLMSSVAPIWLNGDEETLRELVTNLLANALQYTPSGGRVEVDLVHDDPWAVLSVKDTGIGIAPEIKDRLFEEFFRGPQAKDVFANGTGLGLTIVQRIVEAHQGRIEVGSCPGGGAVFTVHLRLHLPRAANG